MDTTTTVAAAASSTVFAFIVVVIVAAPGVVVYCGARARIFYGRISYARHVDDCRMTRCQKSCGGGGGGGARSTGPRRRGHHPENVTVIGGCRGRER